MVHIQKCTHNGAKWCTSYKVHILEGTLRFDYPKLTVHIMKVENDDIQNKLRDIDFFCMPL